MQGPMNFGVAQELIIGLLVKFRLNNHAILIIHAHCCRFFYSFFISPTIFYSEDLITNKNKIFNF